MTLASWKKVEAEYQRLEEARMIASTDDNRQLTALAMLTVALAKNGAGEVQEHELVSQLLQLPALVEKTLKLDAAIQALAEVFADKHHALFLGRGPLHAIAMEGALKLKEISYIHAEAYAAAELKHGPLALVDEDMPVVAVAPNNELLEKLKSNLQEVRARGGKLFVFADPQAHFHSEEGVTVIEMPAPSTALQRVRAVLCTAEQAELLQAKEKDDGLLVERLGFLKDGSAAEFTQSYYRGDIYDFVAELSVSS